MSGCRRPWPADLTGRPFPGSIPAMSPSPAKSVAATLALIVAYVALRLGLSLTPAESTAVASVAIGVAGTLVHSLRRSRPVENIMTGIRQHRAGYARGLADAADVARRGADALATSEKGSETPPAAPAVAAVANVLDTRAKQAQREASK